MSPALFPARRTAVAPCATASHTLRPSAMTASRANLPKKEPPLPTAQRGSASPTSRDTQQSTQRYRESFDSTRRRSDA
jgi:hypothetical protein